MGEKKKKNKISPPFPAILWIVSVAKENTDTKRKKEEKNNKKYGQNITERSSR